MEKYKEKYKKKYKEKWKLRVWHSYGNNHQSWLRNAPWDTRCKGENINTETVQNMIILSVIMVLLIVLLFGLDSQGSVILLNKYCFPNLYWIHWSITKWSDSAISQPPMSLTYFLKYHRDPHQWKVSWMNCLRYLSAGQTILIYSSTTHWHLCT